MHDVPPVAGRIGRVRTKTEPRRRLLLPRVAPFRQRIKRPERIVVQVRRCRRSGALLPFHLIVIVFLSQAVRHDRRIISARFRTLHGLLPGHESLQHIGEAKAFIPVQGIRKCRNQGQALLRPRHGYVHQVDVIYVAEQYFLPVLAGEEGMLAGAREVDVHGERDGITEVRVPEIGAAPAVEVVLLVLDFLHERENDARELQTLGLMDGNDPDRICT